MSGGRSGRRVFTAGSDPVVYAGPGQSGLAPGRAQEVAVEESEEGGDDEEDGLVDRPRDGEQSGDGQPAERTRDALLGRQAADRS